MRPTLRPCSTLLGVVAAALFSSPSLADDTIKLKDGRSFTGRVVSHDASTVVFETHLRGMRMTARYPRADVVSINRETAAGPAYYALPVVGTIGKQAAAPGAFVSADSFKEALAEVRRAKPDYVVLVIDSPGGSLDEMQEIIKAIGEARELRFVAYVKRAISAAAIIALRCPTICMATDGTMGGAVPFKIGPDGTPQNIEEKFQSILRAEFRRSAELGGHSPLIAQAMMDAELELQLVERRGKPVVVEAEPGATGNIVKQKGRILTLTANEARNCGVSAGTADTLEHTAPLLGIKEWRSLDDKAWFEMVNAADAENQRDQQKRAAAAKVAEWNSRAKGTVADMDKLATAVNEAQSRRDTAIKAAQDLTAGQKAEMDDLKAQWDAERVSIAGSSSTNNSALNASTKRRLADLDAQYTERNKAIKDRTDPDIQEAIKRAKAADDEAKSLYQQWTQLRDKLPAKPKQ